MKIDLGKKVVSLNNRHVGNVDSLVVDYNTKDITSIIVRSGVFFRTDRIFPIETFDHVDDDGTVVLNLTDEEAERQEAFVEREYTYANPNDYPFAGEAWVASTGQPSVYWAYGTAPLGYVNDSPFMAEAPANPPEVEIESNLPERAVRVSEGTDVLGSDGEKIGTVDQVSYSGDGEVDGLVVKSGFLFHHSVRIPGEWIDEVGHNAVRLRVSSDEAQATREG